MNFKTLIEATEYFSSERNCINCLIETRWPGGIKCAFCNHSKIYHLGGTNKRFKCAKCLKTFSIIKGTIFENSQIPLNKWFIAIYLISSHKKGISSIQLGKDIGVTQKTAWFMLHRIRFAFTNNNYVVKLCGVVQCDEVYIGGKNKNRPINRKIPNAQGRSLKDKTPVFGIIETGGWLYTTVVPNTKASTLKPIIEQLVKEGSIVVTDEWKAYQNMPKEYYHITLNHGKEEYAQGPFNTNSIEGFWSLLKRGIFGIYHFVSPKHLQRYCEEFAYRYNSRKAKCYELFDDVMARISCRITYSELTKYNI